MIEIQDGWLDSNTGLYGCPYCDKQFTVKGIGTHIWRAHGEGKDHQINGHRSVVSWRKGLDKTDSRIKKQSEALSESMREAYRTGKRVGRGMSEDQKNKLSIEQSLRNRGGKAKWFDYNGIKVQGTWELRFAKKLDELGIEWRKPTVNAECFEYIWDGKTRHYTPDFYIPSIDRYIEIKGFWWGRDKEKMIHVFECNPELKLLIIEKDSFNNLMNNKISLADLV